MITEPSSSVASIESSGRSSAVITTGSYFRRMCPAWFRHTFSDPWRIWASVRRTSSSTFSGGPGLFTFTRRKRAVKASSIAFRRASASVSRLASQKRSGGVGGGGHQRENGGVFIRSSAMSIMN